MTQTTLPPASHPHDLPPRWDGHPITWTPWERQEPVLICPPLPRDPCPVCGSFAEAAVSRGTIHIDLSGSKRTKRTQAYRRLFAYRCPDCHRDIVTEARRFGEAWLLDDSDYEDEGSRVR